MTIHGGAHHNYYGEEDIEQILKEGKVGDTVTYISDNQLGTTYYKIIKNSQGKKELKYKGDMDMGYMSSSSTHKKKKKSVKKTKKNIRNIQGVLHGTLEFKKKNKYMIVDDSMIDTKMKLNTFFKKIEDKLEKQINFKSWTLKLEHHEKVVIEWTTKENKKFKFPKVTYLEIEDQRYRIKWNHDTLQYDFIQ